MSSTISVVKQCNVCESDFCTQNQRRIYCSPVCRVRAFQLRHPDKRRYNELKQNLRRLGMTVKQYNALLRKQNFQCGICKTFDPGKNQFGNIRFAIDHDHKTGRIRGLLCQSCNHLLGKAHDSVELLQSAIEYLQ